MDHRMAHKRKSRRRSGRYKPSTLLPAIMLKNGLLLSKPEWDFLRAAGYPLGPVAGTPKPKEGG